MKTLEQAFSERQSTYQRVEKESREILDAYCRRRGFIFVGRAKTLDSLRDKLETGRYPDLDSVDDAIAFSVVIDTLGQEGEVRKFLAKSFRLVSINAGTTLQDERVFDFDCTRIYCRLEDKLEVKSGVELITIEVQIRTILQHAWSKITHPLVYKADRFDAKAGRLAAELMAQLESIDRSFSRFKTSSRSIKIVSRRDMVASGSITSMIDQLVDSGIIPRELRPSNGRRLGENIYKSMSRDARHTYPKYVAIIKNLMESQREIFPRSVTLYQLAIVALHSASALDFGTTKKPHRYYVTDELVSLFPIAAKIPNQIRIE